MREWIRQNDWVKRRERKVKGDIKETDKVRFKEKSGRVTIREKLKCIKRDRKVLGSERDAGINKIKEIKYLSILSSYEIIWIEFENPLFFN